MKIPVIIISLLLLLRPGIYSQTSSAVDSLNLVLQKTTLADTTRVQTLIALAGEHYLENPEAAMKDCEEALQVSSSANYYEGMATAYGWMAYLYEQKGDIDQALKNNASALTMAQKAGLKKQVASIFNNMAAIYENLGKTDLAIEFNNKSITIRKEMGDETGVATSYNNIGLLLFNRGNIRDALDYYHKALLIYEKNNDSDGLSTTLMNIGSVHKDQKEYHEAKNYYDRALFICRKSNDKYGEGFCLNGLGNLYQETGKADSAIIFYNQALAIRKSIDDKEGVSFTLKNLGKIMAAKNEIAIAKTYFNESLSGMIEMSNQKGIAEVNNQLGVLAMLTGDMNNASMHLSASLKVAKEIGNPALIRDAAENLSQLYRKKNEWKSALEMYDLFTLMRDSISNDNNRKALLQAQFKYEFDQKTMQLKAAQEKKDLMARAESRKQRILIYSFVSGLVLTILLLFFVFRNYNNQKKANLLLKETQDQLIQSEKMAAFGVMASRVAHEIQNPLNFVNNFSELSKDLVSDFVTATSENEKSELAGELITNLDKINHHGKRAGEIVRQLQEHSRLGTAQDYFENS